MTVEKPGSVQCPTCSGAGWVLVSQGCTVACRDCDRGRLELRLRLAEKHPGADPWADDLIADYAHMAAEE